MSTNHRSRYSAARRSFEDEQFWRNEKEPAHMHAAPVNTAPALHERIGAAHLSCCGEVRCTCPVVPEPPQQFAIRVERLTENGFIGTDLDMTFWAADAMTAIRRARSLFGSMWQGWMFLAVPQ